MSESQVAPEHMTREEFRQAGLEFIDLICDYWEDIEELPVNPSVDPGSLLEALPESPPQEPESWDDIQSDVRRLILPAITNWQSPGFFGYFPANASAPAVLGELLSAGLGVQGMLWSTSPACTELEMRMLDWLGEMIGLPDTFMHSSGVGGGVIQGTASEASLVALVAARSRWSGGGELKAYASDQAHSSIAKAIRICGLQEDDLRLIKSDPDDAYAMQSEALEERIKLDVADGVAPFFICATVGTTSTGALDSVRELGRIARQCGAWLHVDAAYAGSALVCPEHRAMIDGIERADSFCFNPHKWLLTNFDLSALWVQDRAHVLNALSITPEYLKNTATERGGVVDFRDWQIPLGRRFRALKLWFVIRQYGVAGLQAYIRRHIELASQFEQWVEEDDRFELVAPRCLSLVCFRLRGDDDRTRELLERLNATGEVFLTHSAVPDSTGTMRYFIRMAIGATKTEDHHVQRAWSLIQRETSAVLDGG